MKALSLGEIISQEAEKMPAHKVKMFEEVLSLNLEDGTEVMISQVKLNYSGLIDGYHYASLLPYYPKNKYDWSDLSESDADSRNLILSFKGKNFEHFRYPKVNVEFFLIGLQKFLFDLGHTLDDNYLLACIPASNELKTSIRFSHFIKLCSNRINIENGYEVITISKEREEVKNNRNQDRLEGIVYSSDLISERNIILIDDIITTGKSFREHANSLKNYGAKSVIGFFFGKTV